MPAKMKKDEGWLYHGATPHPSLRRFAAVAALFFSAFAFGAQPFQSAIGDPQHWTATKWSQADIERFGGMPIVLKQEVKNIILRYTYYVSDYDLEHRVPFWVAHVNGRDSELKARSRTGKGTRWDRKGDGFSPDPNLRWAAGQANLRFVSDASYNKANPPDFAETRDTKITRGHMASNLEMKSQGSEDDGDQSQSESFSLANACPQMQAHNNPIWSKLEDQCMAWAGAKDGVAVISGPIFAPVQGQPLPISKQLETDGGNDGVKIPIPTAFFKVVIAVKDGKRTAVGFIVPHRNDLFDKTRPDRGLAALIVPIRDIERATGINFMPALGPNTELEAAKARDWQF
jgi:DNA/RNA endonuclease G (NUC1)